MPRGPSFVSVTYHQAHIKKKVIDGIEQISWNRKKPGSIGVCAAMKFRHHAEVLPHVICGGFSKSDTEDFLLDLDYLGLENVLALRGDPAPGNDRFEADADGHNHANELVRQIVNMNKAEYIDSVEKPVATNFCIGVAGYPDKHHEALDMQDDIQNLANKVEAGGDYIVTQMVFDTHRYLSFVDTCREAGIDVPIVPGLKVLSSKKQAEALSRIFHVYIPEDVKQRLSDAGDAESQKEVGIQHAFEMSCELSEEGVPDLHYYSMNRITEIGPVIDQLLDQNQICSSSPTTNGN